MAAQYITPPQDFDEFEEQAQLYTKIRTMTTLLFEIARDFM
jgi:hypothetical protein